MKGLSTVRDTQRGSQSYMEKRRRRREIEVTKKTRGGIKRENWEKNKKLFLKFHQALPKSQQVSEQDIPS